MGFTVPDWRNLSKKEQRRLLKKVLTETEIWLTVKSGSPYDQIRWELIDHIIETDFIKVQATNVLQYWIEFSDNLLNNIDLNDIRWKRILWKDVVYMLTNFYYEENLSDLVRRVMINNYVNLLEIEWTKN